MFLIAASLVGVASLLVGLLPLLILPLGMLGFGQRRSTRRRGF